MDYMSTIAYIPAGRDNRITREKLIKLKTEVFNNAQQDN